MQIDGLTWNWVGKLLAILFSLAFYHKFKQNLGQEIYLKVKQQKTIF
jgi:hypothetical protein